MFRRVKLERQTAWAGEWGSSGKVQAERDSSDNRRGSGSVRRWAWIMVELGPDWRIVECLAAVTQGSALATQIPFVQ